MTDKFTPIKFTDLLIKRDIAKDTGHADQIVEDAVDKYFEKIGKQVEGPLTKQ